MDALAPGLLIAMPTLVDPNFFHAVVLMVAHSSDGAFGLVVNHPLDVAVADVCAEASVTWRGGPDRMAFSGGPVDPQRGWVLHRDDRAFEGTQPVGAGVAISASQDALEAYAADPDGPFRLVLGYAGWGPGQLDGELRQGSWITAPLDARLVFDVAPGKTWGEALRAVGVDPRHLVAGGQLLN